MIVKIISILLLRILQIDLYQICKSTSFINVIYFLNSSIKINELTTRDRILFKIDWIGKGNWPQKSSIIMMNLERDDIVFMYKPFDGNAIHENKRVIVTHSKKDLTVKLQLLFFKNEDDESRWSINFNEKENQITSLELCNFFVKSDQTPFVIIEHEIIGKGRFIINKYNEDDKVKVTCTLNKGDLRKVTPFFHLHFPDGSTVEDVTDNRDPFAKIKIITLTKNIYQKIIYCYVVGGDSANDSTILKFNLKKIIYEINDKKTVAISLAVFICILLLVLTFLGAYLLIVKQRKDTTKDLVQHHTRQSQIKMSTVSMSNISRMSRFSKASKMSKISRMSEMPLIKMKTKE